MEQLSRDPAYLPTQPLAPAARGLGLTAFQLVDPSRLPPQIWGTSEDQHWAFLLLATEGERRQTIQTLRSDGKSLADAIDAFTGFGKDAARGIREAVAIIEYRRVYEAMTGRKPTVTRPHADDPNVDFELAVDGGTPEPVDVKTPVPFDASLKSKPSDEEELMKVALRLAGNDALYADWLVEQAEPILEEVGTAHPTSKHVDGGFGGLFDKADEVAEASPGGPSEMINGTVIRQHRVPVEHRARGHRGVHDAHGGPRIHAPARLGPAPLPQGIAGTLTRPGPSGRLRLDPPEPLRWTTRSRREGVRSAPRRRRVPHTIGPLTDSSTSHR